MGHDGNLPNPFQLLPIFARFMLHRWQPFNHKVLLRILWIEALQVFSCRNFRHSRVERAFLGTHLLVRTVALLLQKHKQTTVLPSDIGIEKQNWRPTVLQSICWTLKRMCVWMGLGNLRKIWYLQIQSVFWHASGSMEMARNRLKSRAERGNGNMYWISFDRQPAYPLFTSRKRRCMYVSLYVLFFQWRNPVH